jgi:hypothetical protein
MDDQVIRLDLLKQRFNAGEQLSDDEYREAVMLMRHGRVAAAEAGARKRAAKGPVKSGDELLAELDGLE